MVREAQMNGGHEYGNGAAESPQRVMGRSIRELLGDVMTLGELQYQLFWVDVEQCKARAVVPIVVLAVGGVLLLSCVPIAMVAVALLLEETTRLSPAGAFFVTLGIGLVLGGLLCLGGAWYLRNSFAVLKRSQIELSQNYRWLKQVLGRLGTAPFRRPSTEEHSYP